MKTNNYKPEPGDMEIRILNDGRVFMAVPDEKLIEIAHTLDPNNAALPAEMKLKENKEDARRCRSNTTS
ncbi:MAG: hypothetical protein JW787_11470 [Sedimentisphaerales bacterium]|nr:hypothetical protein [Sedimentisphaerales bacterium]